MKLIYCTACQDVVRVIPDKVRSCECRNVSGKYVNDLDARFTVKNDQEYFLIGFHNYHLKVALQKMLVLDIQPGGRGENFEAFIIPEPCPTFKKVENVD